MGRHMKTTIQLQQKFVTNAGKRDVPLSMRNAKSNTGRVFGVVKDAQTSTAWNETITPTISFSKTSEFSGVVAA